MDTLLKIQSISVNVQNKSKDGLEAIIRDISFDVPSGKMIAILGPSGSGKTTLLMAIAGLLPLHSGHILFRDQPLQTDNEEAMTKWRGENIGIIFQHFHLLPNQTALENVMIPLELNKVPDPEREAINLLETLGLGHRLHATQATLSGGEQQRVALARALAIKPSLILADEPTGNLDRHNGRIVMDLLESHVRQGSQSLLLITHDPELAARCDFQIHLQDGQMI
jgi:putative ABC transport system ATP-binding protein